MNTPVRHALAWDERDGPKLVPAADGPAVLFADVEDALRDRKRLEWLLPVINGEDENVADHRTAALTAGLMLGKTGVELVDYAMEGCPV